MIKKKNGTPWKQKHTAEKSGLLAGWAIVAALMWYWLTLGKSVPSEPSMLSEAQTPAVVHARASAQALIDATQYLSALDTAMTEGLQILKTNQLPQLATQSKVFKSLLDAGNTQFGRSVFEPLGRCSAAGVFANSWWQAKVSVVRQGVSESIPSSIQSHFDEYKFNREECLKLANPLKVASVNKTIQTAQKAL